jgi:hypothetical protein
MQRMRVRYRARLLWRPWLDNFCASAKEKDDDDNFWRLARHWNWVVDDNFGWPASKSSWTMTKIVGHSKYHQGRSLNQQDQPWPTIKLWKFSSYFSDPQKTIKTHPQFPSKSGTTKTSCLTQARLCISNHSPSASSFSIPPTPNDVFKARAF